jgi:hypothetical protein
MPRKARAAAASARHGSMSGEGRELKRRKLESQEIGMAEDKKVCRFFTMVIVYASYFIRKNPA